MVTPRGVGQRPFYIGVSLLMGLIAVVGFWPTYFGPLVRGTVEQPPVIHVHATVFAGWLVLFLAQVVLAATGRVAWHMRLGRLGIGYGIVLILVGLITTVSRSTNLFDQGSIAGARQLLIVGSADMVVFAAFFVAAIVYRRKPQIHKRLMIVAATMLLIAAASRMQFLPLLSLRRAIWMSPVFLAMAYDFRSRHLVHPIYLVGLGAFLVRVVTPPLIAGTETWAAFARWVFTLTA